MRQKFLLRRRGFSRENFARDRRAGFIENTAWRHRRAGTSEVTVTSEPCLRVVYLEYILVVSTTVHPYGHTQKDS